MADFAAIEIEPPDIAPYRAGNTGIDYVTRLSAPLPGPHVVVTALMHGNEICGAIALDHLFRAGLRPARGTLTLAFANVAAYRNFDRDNPHASRYLDEDMNRVWDRAVLDGPRRSRELQRARALLPVVDGADFLLDLHSMASSDVPLTLTGIADKHHAFARRVGATTLLVRDAGHESGRRLRDYSRFAEPDTPPVALLVECGRHWARKSAETAIETTWRFLAATGILADADAAPWLNRPAPPQRTIVVTSCVTAASGDFGFTEAFGDLAIVPRAGTVIARDGDIQIRTPYDRCVLIMPAWRIQRGNTAVRLGYYEDFGGRR